MPADQLPLATPPPSESEAAPRFGDGLVPEAPPRPRGLLVFGLLAFIVLGVALLWLLSQGTPFLLVGGVYFPAWFSSAVVGAAFATVTVIVLRSFSSPAAPGRVWCSSTVP